MNKLLNKRNRKNCKYFLPETSHYYNYRNYWRSGRCKRKLSHYSKRGTHYCTGVNCGKYKLLIEDAKAFGDDKI